MNRDTISKLTSLNPQTIAGLSDSDLLTLARQATELHAYDKQINQLRYYQPVSNEARSVHRSTARTIAIGGGNGSSKTDTALAEMVIRATGQIPLSLPDYPREKLRGPIACRVVCESLTTTLSPIILPKLQWFKWQGVDLAGGARGHWGWIPRHCLIKGEWKSSWQERTRTLRCYYRDPDSGKIEGESMIQCMSYDQDPSDFASGDFHFVLHDEPPKYEIWRENRARVMRVDGTLMVSMTWPDDPTISVDWMLDELYEKGIPGPTKDPNTEWYTFYTTDNPNLNQDAVAMRAAQMSPAERAARIYGQPVRLGNRIYSHFTDTERFWCFCCKDTSIKNESGTCGVCGDSLLAFKHVEALPTHELNPVLCLLDPHPRKPHCLLWIEVTPDDDLEIVHEEEVDGSPQDVEAIVHEVESRFNWKSIRRLMDPNMGRSQSSTDRSTTWQDAFMEAGLNFDLADDSNTGLQFVNDLLKPDEFTQRPRLRIDPSCTRTIYQVKRWIWGDFKRATDRDQKQVPSDKHSDFPTLIKYAVNSNPTFRTLKAIGAIYHRPGVRSKLGY